MANALIKQFSLAISWIFGHSYDGQLRWRHAWLIYRYLYHTVRYSSGVSNFWLTPRYGNETILRSDHWPTSTHNKCNRNNIAWLSKFSSSFAFFGPPICLISDISWKRLMRKLQFSTRPKLNYYIWHSFFHRGL